MISDFAKDDSDAAFSIYYFIGCISGPIWTLIVGYVMERYGFTQAFYVAASTYIAEMLLLTLVKENAVRSEEVCCLGAGNVKKGTSL
jgi:dipeptide/tripeptide permease